MVACTNAPRLTALVISHPDCAGVCPSVPVSWYGVARPRAVSGFAGTMMSQLTLAAAVVVPVLDPDGATDGEALGDALAEAPRAASPRLVTVERPATATTTPITRPNTTGIAIVTAIREEGFLRLYRRHANRSLLIIGSDTSVSESPQRRGIRPASGREARV